MGITGLLPLLASVTEDVSLSQYAGKRVAIDAYVWLHRGAYHCSTELCQNIATHKYITYCMDMINLLRSHHIVPVLVFDGANLPSKKKTNQLRRGKRMEARAKGEEALRQNNPTLASEHFQRGVDVTPRMAYNLMEVLRIENIEFLVAPYEADAQLAFLAQHQWVDVVITVDSDLLVYGCPHVIVKLDKEGHGKAIQLSNIPLARDINLRQFSLCMFRRMCILAGCDYLDNIPSIGLKKAHALMITHNHMEKVFIALENSKSTLMPHDYRLQFARADLTFQHQVVYDPQTMKRVHLNPLPIHIHASDISFAGELMDNESVAQGIANGLLDPYTHQPFVTNTKIHHNPSSSSSTTLTTMQLDHTIDQVDKDTHHEQENNNHVRRDVIDYLRFAATHSTYYSTIPHDDHIHDATLSSK